MEERTSENAKEKEAGGQSPENNAADGKGERGGAPPKESTPPASDPQIREAQQQGLMGDAQGPRVRANRKGQR